MGTKLISYDANVPGTAVGETFRWLAEQFDRTEAVALADDTETVSLGLSESVRLELEGERDGEGGVELRVSVTWPSDAVERSDGDGSDEFAAALSSAVDRSDTAAPEPAASQATFELYEDRADEWRWRLVHRNGNIIADGGEGYTSKQNARKGIRSVKTNAAGAEVIELQRETDE